MPELPDDAAEAAERLTRLAREAVDDGERAAYRREREERLAEHDYTARVRDDDGDDVLVLHPEEWVEDGRIRTERIDDLDRAVEIPLEGPGDPEEWEQVREHNEEIVERVRAEHGDVHAANAAAFADFMQNHYARTVESASVDEIEEFLAEYYPRNAWPSEEQRAVVDRSIELVFEAADARIPDF